MALYYQQCHIYINDMDHTRRGMRYGGEKSKLRRHNFSVFHHHLCTSTNSDKSLRNSGYLVELALFKRIFLDSVVAVVLLSILNKKGEHFFTNQ